MDVLTRPDGTILIAEYHWTDPVGPYSAISALIPTNLPKRFAAADFSADRRSELAVYRPSMSEWHVQTESQPYSQWGIFGDKPFAIDYDGDGRADLAMWRQSTGKWHIRTSSTGYSFSSPEAAGIQWGQPNGSDIAIPADFDADGLTDLAIYRPSVAEWWVRFTATGNYETYHSWGAQGDMPFAIDYDGDRRADLAMWRPSNATWYIRTSSTNYSFSSTEAAGLQWGAPAGSDVPIPADFNGDGTVELAIFRPSVGEWWIRWSAVSWMKYEFWGLQGDIPLPLDHDGDGVADLAVWRPSVGTWHIRTSSTGYSFESAVNVQWGLPGDTPLFHFF